MRVLTLHETTQDDSGASLPALVSLVEAAAFLRRLCREGGGAFHLVVLIRAIGKAIEHPQPDQFLRDADLGLGLHELRTRCRVEIDPTLRRGPGTGGIIGEDLPAIDLNAEIRLHRRRHARLRLIACLASDDEGRHLIG